MFLLLLAAVLVQLAHGAYRWFAFAEERAILRRLDPRMEVAGLEVVRTQLRVDSLRREILALDRELKAQGLEMERDDGNGGRRWSIREVEIYNRSVRERNRKVDEWRDAVEASRNAVSRYNRLADTIRLVAGRMGEQHYRIPTPAEAAQHLGLSPE